MTNCWFYAKCGVELAQAGTDETRPVVWCCEGILLTGEGFEVLFEDTAVSAVVRYTKYRGNDCNKLVW
ncbi:hypothetical protein [Kamptonema sp. UHCC 0994]|uniref:hypothetical protein n=1 Tax=Kamptonema sp. UHCC 0994 TaxID=3031329 RepID=UPI0023B89D44|nr:hypothetical protein [Kamptonema sp. UHCC 0994]MDF0555628.1 hypothetical protein [Kamptonema sp. UHCC 0994]